MIRAVALLLGSFIATAVAEDSKPNPPDGGTGRLRQLAEFVHALHVTDDGQDYLYERVPDSRGFSHTRIQRLRARMYVPSDTILDLVRNEERPPGLRALALRFLSPMDEEIDLRLVHDLLESNDPTLRLEMVRTLQGSPLSGAPEMLRAIATDENEEINLRAEAVLGLADHATSAANRQLLRQLARSRDETLQTESLRSLRGLAASNREVRHTLIEMAGQLKRAASPPSAYDRELAEQLVFALGGCKATAVPPVVIRMANDARPKNLAQWRHRLNTGGDPIAGRRVFFHPHSAGCFKCHTITGRGGRIGPNLSGVGRSWSRQKLIQKLVDPPAEIAFRYVVWSVVTNDGKVFSGMILHEQDDQITLGTLEGNFVDLKTDDIDARVPLKVPLMPANLVDLLTVNEFRNLLAFLEGLWD